MTRAALLIMLAIAACGSKAEAVPAPPLAQPTSQASQENTDSCLQVGSALDPTLAAKLSGCPCDAKLQRDSCIDALGFVCEHGRWQVVKDGPCSQVGPTDPAACAADLAKGEATPQSCACVGDFCQVQQDEAHVCSAGRWLKVSVADCWLRVKARTR